MWIQGAEAAELQRGPGGLSEAQAESRVNQLLGRMTLEEKIDLLSGTGFDSRGVPRLGIPALKMTDGPMGVRGRLATAFPASIGMGSSFDLDLVERAAAAMAREAKFYGKNVLLGPCVNIARTLIGGRNFESYGEDPFLNGRMAKAYIQGLQGEGVAAVVKHFGLNDQEYNRHTIDIRVDRDTMMELHLRPFRDAVQAGVWAVMTSYNKLNGVYASENMPLVRDLLKRKWGFRGLVMSDWESVHSTVGPVRAGLDLEMPTGKFMNRSILTELQKGRVLMEDIDDKVRRHLRVLMVSGIWKEPKPSDGESPRSREHRSLALEAAQKSLILLKNEGPVLPLSYQKVKQLAVIGPNASVLRVGGGGSSKVNSFGSISALDALRDRMGRRTQVVFEQGDYLAGDHLPLPPKSLTPPPETRDRNPSSLGTGFGWWRKRRVPVSERPEYGVKVELFLGEDLSGVPAYTTYSSAVDITAVDVPAGLAMTEDYDVYSARWTGRLTPEVSGEYELFTVVAGGHRVWLGDKLIFDEWNGEWHDVRGRRLQLEAGKTYDLRVEYVHRTGWPEMRLGWIPPHQNLIQQAVEKARVADAAVVFVGFHEGMESEGFDRSSYNLPGDQERLIQEVARVQPNTVVVVKAGSPVVMKAWQSKVPAIVWAGYPGSRGGEAIADVLTGVVSPSGKVTIGFVETEKHHSSTGWYPGDGKRMRYGEGIFVGYRHLDRKGLPSPFPFGHGLTYSKFSLSQVKIEPVSSGVYEPRVVVEGVLRNDGPVVAAEVVQVYVGRDGNAFPVRELKEFVRLNLKPGEERSFRLELARSAFERFNSARDEYQVAPGRYRIEVGLSSRDIKAAGSVQLSR